MAHPTNKKQILIIHGGDSFRTYDEYLANLKNIVLDYDRLKPSKRWKDAIVTAFPGTDILAPTMPNSTNAQFDEWKIWFEKIIPFFGNDVRIIGHSLGAMFLAKYFHQHQLKQPVRQLILIAGGYNSDITGYGSFALESAIGLEKSAEEIHIIHSEDDFVVPYSELAKYEHDLPMATIHRFTDKNHFLDAEFPELIEILKQK